MAQHVDIPTLSEVTALLEERSPASVSIYLPTSPLPQDADADRIAFKNLATQAASQLVARGDHRAVVAVREHAHDLLDDDAFWGRLAASLAVFITPAGLRTFRLPNRLNEMVEVSDRMHLSRCCGRSPSRSPPSCSRSPRAARGSSRSPATCRRPRSPWPRCRPTSRARSARPRSPTARRRAGSRARRARRCGSPVRAAGRSRRPQRGERAGQPLILAGAEPLSSIYRSVNRYPRLAGEGIPGNPEAATDQDLADAAREILDRLYADELRDLRDLFEARVSQGRGASDLTDVARAATFGAVDTLLADIDVVVPGFIDEESGAVTLADHDDAVNYGVVDEIARRVLLHGGRVLALRAEDIPGDTSTAAILRYPV